MRSYTLREVENGGWVLMEGCDDRGRIPPTHAFSTTDDMIAGFEALVRKDTGEVPAWRDADVTRLRP